MEYKVKVSLDNYYHSEYVFDSVGEACDFIGVMSVHFSKACTAYGDRECDYAVSLVCEHKAAEKGDE